MSYLSKCNNKEYPTIHDMLVNLETLLKKGIISRDEVHNSLVYTNEDNGEVRPTMKLKVGFFNIVEVTDIY